MGRRLINHLLIAVVLMIPALALSENEEEFTFDFDVSKFEKKPFELRGYGEFEVEYGKSDINAALYQLQFFGEEEQSTLDQYTGTLELDGRYRDGIATFIFRTHSEIVWNYEGEDQNHRLYEGLLTIQPSPSLTYEIGKKVNRWGKGYAWNPVGFVERVKDPGDPDLSREGYTIVGLDWIRSYDGALQAVAFTPMVLPVVGELNERFGEPTYLNPAAKLYFLYRDIDIDLMFLGEGSRTARYGIDFAKNLAPNFEIHGEFAYITDVTKRLLTPPPSCRSAGTNTEDEISYLLGLRYRTNADLTWIFEYYFNGAGNSEEQQRNFYRCVHFAWDEQDKAIFDRLSVGDNLNRGPFTRPNPMQRYVNLKVSWNEPFDILYFVPGAQVLYNLDDDSFAVTPELLYTGIDNLELRLRAMAPVGDTLTEWGEKLNEYRIEFRMRYYF